MNNLKIATFNINSFRGYPQGENKGMEPIAEIIKDNKPEILGLNEVSSGSNFGIQPNELAEKSDYPYFYYGPVLKFYPDFSYSICENGADYADLKENERYYGNALFSLYPIKKAELIHIPDPEIKDEDKYYESRGIIKAEIDVLGGITVLVTHFGLAKAEQKNAVQKILELLGEDPQKTVLMGDFNVLPEDEVLLPIREILKDTADGFEKSDLLSYPSDGGDRKIDYIFVSKDLIVKDTSVVNKPASDHKMIKAEVEVNC